jgi:alpha,alpha-trehalase
MDMHREQYTDPLAPEPEGTAAAPRGRPAALGAGRWVRWGLRSPSRLGLLLVFMLGRTSLALADAASEQSLDCRAPEAANEPLQPPPDVLFGDLFAAVQNAQLFEDQKVFVDAIPLFDPEQIREDFAAERGASGFDLAAFVDAHFSLPVDPSVTPPENQSLRDHIDWLWPALTRTTASVPAWSSLIALPKPYVVPGGRFREVYYWDSYFTMLGLAEAGQDDLVLDMLQNFAHEIDRFGHVPNGNRTYYLSRSQPPFFSHMVELAARLAGDALYATYLPELQREHGYWMTGLEQTAPGSATAHVVVLADGTVLNRYWDALDTPRSESFIQDVQTAASVSDRPPSEVYRDLRAAAESGWDFSSRWLGDGRTLATIRTTSIIPVDLNSLLFHLESTIIKGCRIQGDRRCVKAFGDRASDRAQAIERYLYSESAGHYADYDIELGAVRDDVTAAALYPLFVGVARRQRAQETAETVGAALLEAGGLSTSSVDTGEQWDAPNGWAPLQWIAVRGLERYGAQALAREVGTRFLANVEGVYAAEGKLVEKYDVEAGATGGGGGEYPLQDGFGWTNGVTLLLLDRHAPIQSAPSQSAPNPSAPRRDGSARPAASTIRQVRLR